MESDYLQTIRYKLQKRVRNLKSTNEALYRSSLNRFWNFLTSIPIFELILQDLEIKYAYVDVAAKKWVDINCDSLPTFSLEDENAALCLFILKRILNDSELQKIDNLEVRIGSKFLGEVYSDNGLESFNENVIVPLYDYIDESIDDRRSILSVILKYKQRTEWFYSKELFQLWEGNTSRGEKFLQKDLYKYLFDKGIDFVLEPSSNGGEIDLIENQKEKRLLVEVKIFNPEKSKGIKYIASGFRQLYDYTLNYNEPFGYLIIFKTSDEHLVFNLENEDKYFQCLTHNNKTIFIVVVDLYEYENSASKRGILKNLEISKENLIQSLESTFGK
jgi:hypothetical protein